MDSRRVDPLVINRRQKRLQKIKSDQRKYEERRIAAQRFPQWRALLSADADSIDIRSIDHRLDKRRDLEAIEEADLVLPTDMREFAPILQRTAEVLGVRVSENCPLCARRSARRGMRHNAHRDYSALGDLRDTYWVYSTHLSRQSGTGRSINEILSFIRERKAGELSLSVHTVEICLVCGWNYLIHEDLFTSK